MALSIEFLGTGTSQGIPILGCKCEVCISPNEKNKRLRCSILIRDEKSSLIIDVGPDFRQQMLRSNVDKIDAVLLTHEHNDHIIGMDDLRPYMFRQKIEMPIYGEARVLNEVKNKFAYAFKEKLYPGAPRFDLHEIQAGELFKIDGMLVQAIRVMHGDLPILGYRIGAFAYLTDAKTLTEDVVNSLQGLDVLVLSALRKAEHHSHLNLSEAIFLAGRIGAKKTYLTHFSHLMGLHEEFEKELPKNIFPAYDRYLIKV